MNHCLREFGTQEEQDRAREEWFSKIDERKQQRQQEALERKENEKNLKDWWGMDDNWQRIDRKMDAMQAAKDKASSSGG
jgi:COX assembly protein 1